MLLWLGGSLFLASFVRGEWVEISQTLSRPQNSKSSSTPAYYVKTHGTIATERTFTIKSPDSAKFDVQNNKSDASEEEEEKIFGAESKASNLFLQEELDEELLNEEKSSGDEDGYSHGGFLPYLQSIQSTLMKHTHKNVKSKVSLLQNLRDSLLSNIKEKITNLWRPIKEKRQAKNYHESGDYHMDFPSNEGALMTIGFLTFAVFLIKLVLKLIHSLKNKSNGMNGMATVTTTVGRKRREVLDEEAVRILHWIEEYKFQ